MEFVVMTYTPPQRVLLGVTPGHWAVVVMEADDLEQLKEKVKIPLLGECRIAPRENVVIIKSKIVNEEV